MLLLEKTEINQYAPGRCNIGPVEIKRRYRIGYTGLILMIVFIVLAELFRFAQPWKLLLFIPSFYALSGFIQAWKKFCYVYGYIGVFSFEGRKTFTKVHDNQFKRSDRKTVVQLISLIVLGSGIMTALYYFLPD